MTTMQTFYSELFSNSRKSGLASFLALTRATIGQIRQVAAEAGWISWF